MADDQGAPRKSARVQGLSPAQSSKLSPGPTMKTRAAKGDTDSAKKKGEGDSLKKKTTASTPSGDSAKKKTSSATPTANKKLEPASSDSSSGGAKKSDTSHTGGASARKAANIQKAPDGSLIYRRRSSVGSRGSSASTPDKDGGKQQTPVGRMHGTRLSTGSLRESPASTVKPTSEGGAATKLRKRSTSHDSEPSATNIPPSPKKRRMARLSSNQDNKNDFYCWQCHGEGRVICCELCPRVYHIKCLAIEKEPTGEWVCPECEKVMRAECVDTRSKAMSLITVDQLVLLLKYALQRMKCQGSEPFQKPVDTAQFPYYSEYVFHPVDLGTLERNIKKKMYGSTEAFLADTKWILHNCIIFNGKHNKLTSVCKTIVKIAKHEMNEIEICPDCYFNSCTKRGDNWFCEPCRVPHELVWAKMRGYPFWPAKALRVVKEQVDCRFFGEHDRAWVHVSSVFLLSEEYPVLAKKKTQGFDQSMDELSVHINRIKEKFGSFEYAPVRTQFDPKHKYLQSKFKDEDNLSIKNEDDDSYQGSVTNEHPDPSTPETPEPDDLFGRGDYIPVRGRPRKMLGVGRGGHSNATGRKVVEKNQSQSVRTAQALKTKYSRKSIITTRRGKAVGSRESDESQKEEEKDDRVVDKMEVEENISDNSFVNEGVDDCSVEIDKSLGERSESNSPDRSIKGQASTEIKPGTPEKEEMKEEITAAAKNEASSSGVFITSSNTQEVDKETSLKSMSLRSGELSNVNPKLPDKNIISKIEEKVKKLNEEEEVKVQDASEPILSAEEEKLEAESIKSIEKDSVSDKTVENEMPACDKKKELVKEDDRPKNQRNEMAENRPANEKASLGAEPGEQVTGEHHLNVIESITMIPSDPKKNPHLAKIVESCKEKLGISDEEEIHEKSKDKEDDEDEDKEEGDLMITSGSGEDTSGEESEEALEQAVSPVNVDPDAEALVEITCHYCGKVCDNPVHLSNHVVRCLPPIHPFQCNMCYKTFSHRSNCIGHLKAKHKMQADEYDTFVGIIETVNTVKIKSPSSINRSKTVLDPETCAESDQSFASSQSDKLVMDLDDSSDKLKVGQQSSKQHPVRPKPKRSTSPKTGKIVKRKKDKDGSVAIPVVTSPVGGMIKPKKGEMYKINTGKETLKLSIGQLKMLEAAGKLKDATWRESAKGIGEKVTPPRPKSLEDQGADCDIEDNQTVDNEPAVTLYETESDEEIRNYRMEMDKSVERVAEVEGGPAVTDSTLKSADDKQVGDEVKDSEKMDTESAKDIPQVKDTAEPSKGSSTVEATEDEKTTTETDKEGESETIEQEQVPSEAKEVEDMDTSVPTDNADEVASMQKEYSKDRVETSNNATDMTDTSKAPKVNTDKQEIEGKKDANDQVEETSAKEPTVDKDDDAEKDESVNNESNNKEETPEGSDAGSQEDPIPVDDDEDVNTEVVNNTSQKTTKEFNKTVKQSEITSKKVTGKKQAKETSKTDDKTDSNESTDAKSDSSISRVKNTHRTATSGVELPNLDSVQCNVMEGLTDFSAYTDQMMSAVKDVMEQMAKDLVAKQTGQNMKSAFRLELEKLKWRHEQELMEIKHNAAVQMAEMRLSFERTQRKTLEDVVKSANSEKEKAINETKKKQWCAQCGKEAIFYCCWNTSYCDYLCQQEHWPQHMSACTQSGGHQGNDTADQSGAAAVGSSDTQRIAPNTNYKEQARDNLSSVLNRHQMTSPPFNNTPAMTPIAQPGGAAQQAVSMNASQFQVQPRNIIPGGDLYSQQQPPLLMSRRAPGTVDLIRGPVYQPRSY